jgi:hypothetical protein
LVLEPVRLLVVLNGHCDPKATWRKASSSLWFSMVKITQGEVQRYENNYKALNRITTALGRNVYDHVSHLETTHDVWLKLCNAYEGSSELKSSRKDTYNRQYQTISQKPGESLDD